MLTTYAVAVGVADVRRDPDATSELVTQALLNVVAQGGETSGDWTRVVLSDYEGWMRTDELAEPARKGFTKIGVHCATPLDLTAVVAATHTPLFAALHSDESIGEAYLSSALPLLDTTAAERLQVALPGDETAWVARGAVSIRRGEQAYPKAPISIVTTYARALIGVPYVWGGTSWRGIDCSGFVQLCYRMGGYIIPRDADQQHDALTRGVERADLHEGDLVFFGRPNITHVGMALDNHTVIHAEGRDFHRVMINSLDPASQGYSSRLDESLCGIKRVIE